MLISCDFVSITGRRDLCDMPRLGDPVAHVLSVRGMDTDEYGRTRLLPKEQATACCPLVCQAPAPNDVSVF